MKDEDIDVRLWRGMKVLFDRQAEKLKAKCVACGREFSLGTEFAGYKILEGRKQFYCQNCTVNMQKRNEKFDGVSSPYLLR